jgi:hypothetical protein
MKSYIVCFFLFLFTVDFRNCLIILIVRILKDCMILCNIGKTIIIFLVLVSCH